MPNYEKSIVTRENTPSQISNTKKASIYTETLEN